MIPYFRTDIINMLIQKHNYQDYLEIGIDEGYNFQDVVEISGNKHGVDPNLEATGQVTHRVTSDEFFKNTTDTYDIIFIDGLHEAVQAHRDALNALLLLREGGTLLMHDCSPPRKDFQVVPQPEGADLWCGDVWRAWLRLRQRPDLYMEVVDIDWGVGIIQRGTQTPIQKGAEDMTYEQFNADRTQLLNLVPANYVMKRWLI